MRKELATGVFQVHFKKFFDGSFIEFGENQRKLFGIAE